MTTYSQNRKISSNLSSHLINEEYKGYKAHKGQI